MGMESFESKKLFLEAALAEYKRLTDEMMNHTKNASYIFAVMVGGVATLLSFSEPIGIVSFLAIPVFVSSCGSLILSENFSSAMITYYIIEEIEHRTMSELFPHGSPIRYSGVSESRYGWWGGVFWGILFLMSFFLCLGCLIAFALVWGQVSQDIFHQVLYIFGWMTLAFYTLSATLVYRKIYHDRRKAITS